MQRPQRRLRLAVRTPRGRLALALGVPILAFFLVTSASRLLEGQNLARQADEVRQEVAALESRNGELQRQLQYLRSNEYIERIAREELDLVKPGETAIVIVTPQDQERARTGGVTEPAPPPAPPNWQRWRDYFFGPAAPVG